MKKPYKIIELLETIEQPRAITNLGEAAFIRRFKSIKPECVTLTFPESVNKHSPYFTARLTPRGIYYLNELRGTHAVS